MSRIVIYGTAAIAVLVPAALLGSTLFASEQDQLDRIVGSVESDRLDGILDAADFESAGLVVSAGRDRRRFSDRDAARSLLEERTGIAGARSVRLRQQQVTVREHTATAILNVELDEGEYVALRMELTKHEDRWLVQRIRVMG